MTTELQNKLTANYSQDKLIPRMTESMNKLFTLQSRSPKKNTNNQLESTKPNKNSNTADLIALANKTAQIASNYLSEHSEFICNSFITPKNTVEDLMTYLTSGECEIIKAVVSGLNDSKKVGADDASIHASKLETEEKREELLTSVMPINNFEQDLNKVINDWLNKRLEAGFNRVDYKNKVKLAQEFVKYYRERINLFNQEFFVVPPDYTQGLYSHILQKSTDKINDSKINDSVDNIIEQSLSKDVITNDDIKKYLIEQYLPELTQFITQCTTDKEIDEVYCITFDALNEMVRKKNLCTNLGSIFEHLDNVFVDKITKNKTEEIDRQAIVDLFESVSKDTIPDKIINPEWKKNIFNRRLDILSCILQPANLSKCVALVVSTGKNVEQSNKATTLTPCLIIASNAATKDKAEKIADIIKKRLWAIKGIIDRLKEIDQPITPTTVLLGETGASPKDSEYTSKNDLQKQPHIQRRDHITKHLKNDSKLQQLLTELSFEKIVFPYQSYESLTSNYASNTQTDPQNIFYDKLSKLIDTFMFSPTHFELDEHSIMSLLEKPVILTPTIENLEKVGLDEKLQHSDENQPSSNHDPRMFAQKAKSNSVKNDDSQNNKKNVPQNEESDYLHIPALSKDVLMNAIHAEQLVMLYVKKEQLQVANNTLGLSKLCCQICKKFLEQFPHIKYTGSHQNTFANTINLLTQEIVENTLPNYGGMYRENSGTTTPSTSLCSTRVPTPKLVSASHQRGKENNGSSGDEIDVDSLRLE